LFQELVMKKFSSLMSVAFAAWALSAAPLAQAAEAGLTRAEVMAEYVRARAAGELPLPSQLHGPHLSQALAESMGSRGQLARTASLPH
jgi:hypothetical protein